MIDRQTLTRPDDRTTPTTDNVPARKLDLSLTQVAGGALAAMTTAALGSRLGVAGTIAGAALASVVAAVAGAFYTASLRTTRERVTRVVSGTARRRRVAATAEPGLSGTEPLSHRAAGKLARLPRGSAVRILVGAAAAFGLAAVLLTGYEAIAGEALSGGSGTTVGKVSSGNSGGSSDSDKSSDSDEKDKDTDTQDEEAPEPSPSAESSDEPENEADPSQEPTQTKAPTQEPAPEPSSQQQGTGDQDAEQESEAGPAAPAEPGAAGTP